MIKGSIHKDGTTIVNIYATNMRISKYAKQTLIVQKRNTNITIIVRDFNNPLSAMDTSDRK